MEFGSWGWDWDAWEPSFYPSDLPEDWRLNFYANEFSLVVIPGERAARLKASTLREWDQSLDAQFGFLVEVPASLRAAVREPTTGRFLEKLDALGGRLRGLLWPVEGSVAERLLAFREAGARDLAPLYLVGEPRGLDWQAAGEGIGHAWTGSSTADLRVDGPAIVDSGLPLAELREAVERYCACLRKADPRLILKGQPPDPQRLREARVMLELMGL